MEMEQAELPEGWGRKSLGDKNVLIDIQPGFACGIKDVVDGIPHLRMNNISKDGFIDMSLVRRVPKDKAEKAGKWLEHGDIIFNNTNSTELVGKASIFTGWKEQCTFSNHITRLRCNPKVLASEWLYLCLRELWISGYFAMNCVQFVGQSAFNINKLKEIAIPVPPLPEQRRIVSRVENQISRVEQIRKILFEFEKNYQGALYGMYADITKGADYLYMSEVAPLVRRSIKVETTNTYPELGIRSFGKGTFHKPALTGKELGSKRIFRIEEGDLLFNIVFAWEGAVAVARPKDHGRVGSHRFLTCIPKKGIATSPFLCFHFLTERGLHDLGNASPGGAGRNRTLGLKALDKIKVPVPSYQKQLWFSALWEKTNQAKLLHQEISKELAAYTPALLAKAFRGEL